MNIKFQIYLIIIILLNSCQSSFEIKKNVVKPFLKKQNISDNVFLLYTQKKQIQLSDSYLSKNFKTVLDKKIIAASGNVKDFYSQAIYFWPDSSEGKIKWVARDGVVNKNSLNETDHNTFSEAMGAIRELSLSFYLTNSEKYADKALYLINQWFVDPTIKMNPNFQYAQAVPGKSSGSPGGIITSRAIVWVVNSYDFLKSSKSFDNEEYLLFKDWCTKYLEWLTNSEAGNKAGNRVNNHGTFYDLLVAELSNFTENFELCNSTLQETLYKRIKTQISSDGSMPHELDRTKPIHYSLFNLSAFFHLAILGDRYNIDLWNAKTDTSGSVVDAFDYILSQVRQNKNKSKINYSHIIGLLIIANNKFKNKYEQNLKELTSLNHKLRLRDSYFTF
jgi:Alginate lyase